MNAKSFVLALAAGVAAVAVGTVASAGPTAQYFDVPDTGGGGDFNTCCSSPPATLPVITLGSSLDGGLPVTTLAAASGGVIDQSASGQILWWTPSATTGITATGSGPFALNQLHSMFPPNSTGTNNGTDFETAIISATLTGSGAPASVTVTSDDDAFVYVDGLYVGGNPGVHGAETTTISLGDLTGSHSLEVFYADRAQVDAVLGVNVTGAAVPEPATWAVMLLGFGGIGAAMRSRRRQTATA
jgi:hypothetical protein